MDIKLEITLKDKDYGFSDLLDGRELNNQTKQEILELIKEDIGYAFDQQIEVKQLNLSGVVGQSEQLVCDNCKNKRAELYWHETGMGVKPCEYCKTN